MTINKWIIPVLFLIAPFVYLSPGLIWRSQLLFFLIIPIFIVAFSIRNIWIKSFLLYATTWQIVIFFLGFNNPRFSPGAGLSIILALMSGALIFKLIVESKTSDETWYSVLRIATLIQIALSIPQIMGFHVIRYVLSFYTKMTDLQPTHLTGSVGNRNFLAAFIAFTIPMFIGWKTIDIWGRKVNPIFIGVFVFLLFTVSPAVIAGIIGVAFLLSYSCKTRTRIMYLCLAVLISAVYIGSYVLFTGSHLSEFTDLPGQLRTFFSTGKIPIDPFKGDLGRFAMWMMAIGQLLASWPAAIFGFGPNAFWGREYPLHSEYISMWFQFGLIGLLLMIGYLLTALRFLFRSGNRILLSSFIIICLDMGANFPMEISTTAFVAIIIGALIERKRCGGSLA